MEKYLHHLIRNLGVAAHALRDAVAHTAHGIFPIVKIQHHQPYPQGGIVAVDNGKAFRKRYFSNGFGHKIEVYFSSPYTAKASLIEPMLDKMLSKLRRDQSEVSRMRNRFQVIAENMRVQAHLERILAAIPVPTKEVIFIGIKGRVFAYNLMNEEGFGRMEKGEYEHIYKVVADGDSNRVIKVSTEPEAEK